MNAATPHEAVQALVAAGWSESRIARAAGTSQPTIHRLKHGIQRKVTFEVGAALLQLAAREKPEAGAAN